MSGSTLRALLALLLLLSRPDRCLALPSFGEVRERYASSDAALLDRNGEVLHELRVDPRGRRLAWTRLADISPAMLQALVLSEDRRFREHRGVDWMALGAAGLGNLLSGDRRGASTITMQVAALLDGRLRPGRGKRTLGQKWDQMQAARAMEQVWSKDEVLEAYLNLVTFRGELQGIAAASRGIFDKDPGGLDRAESSVLAALIRSPNAHPERVAARAVLLARSLDGAVPAEEIRALAIDRLSRPYAVRRGVSLAPHAARLLLRDGAAAARSTIDSGVQRFATEALQEALSGLAGRNVQDGAVLVVENRTGEVLAYVGGSGDLSSAPYVDGVQALRQAGSTLKPFLYGLAIEKRIITAASLLEDAPLDLSTGRGVYRPANYDRAFRGTVTARTALASSLNIPAVRTLGLVGGCELVRVLRAFGFSGIADAEHYGPSLALGSADISLWDLVNAYRALANGGVSSGLRLVPGERTGGRRRVLSADSAYIISDILSDREARSATFSLESPLATRFWSAVKTGTSKDMRDNWCVGYSDRYTVGVWVGNFSGASMWDVSGVSGAAPVWLEVMDRLHRTAASRAPKPPAGVVERTVRFPDGPEPAARREWFLAGTERDAVSVALPAERPRILYPVPDLVIAVDPDIPADRQRVFFAATVQAAWTLDGSPVSDGSWSPVPGRHRLSALGTDGVVADEVVFEVR